MKKSINYLSMFILVVLCITTISNSVNAQVFKKKQVEEVEEDETSVGEDGLITDDEGGENKKKKELKKPESIGYPAHDAYAEVAWEYLATGREITKLMEFVKIEMIETGDTSEFTTEAIITNGKGEDVTLENALGQLQDIYTRLQNHQKEGEKLEVLSKAASEEKVPLRLQAKALLQWKDVNKVQLVAVGESGKSIIALGKNISTLVKMKKN
jgi:hypothetical protein